MSKSLTNLRTLPRTKDTRQDPFVFSFLLLNLPLASRVVVQVPSVWSPYPYSALLRTSPPGSRDFNCRDTMPSVHTAGTNGPNRAPGSLFKLVLLNKRCLNGPPGSIEPDSFPKQSWARGEVIVLIDGEHHTRGSWHRPYIEPHLSDKQG